MKLLLAEDEIAMAEAVEDILAYHKYTVDTVYNGEDALHYARSQHYDGLILDIMIPKLDGLSVLEQLRAEGDTTPILLLTAKSEVADRIRGLDAGADDYLPKPFAMGELLSRIRAMLRRRDTYTPETLQLAGLRLNQGSFTLESDSGSVSLSRLEYRLMELLMHNPGITFSADAILERIWGYNSDTEIGSVWVYVSYLRKKLTALNANVEIRSKRGLGYSLEVLK